MARRPEGQPTRGKTALNRLRQVDVFGALALPGVLRSGSPLIVDLGFGAQAWTTLEMRERWLVINPRLRVLGIEIAHERVAAALPHAHPPAVDFRVGGFNLTDVLGSESVRLIRAYNVLRQYDESAVAPALDRLAAALELGGILIEGTSSPSGRIDAFDVYRKHVGRLAHQALVFGTNFRAPVEPVDFQTILPKRLIHHMLDPEPAAFFEAWRRSYERVWQMSGQMVGLAPANSRKAWRGRWIAAAALLKSQFGYPIDGRAGLVRRGYVILYDDLTPKE